MQRPDLEQAQEQLRLLLLRIFSGDEMLRFVRFGPNGQQLIQALPGANSPPAAIAAALVETHARAEAIDDVFFDRLVKERPRREREIRDVQAGFVPGPAAPSAQPRPTRLTDSKIKILMVAVDIEHQRERRVRADVEHREVKDSIEHGRFRDRFSIEIVSAARWDDFRRALERVKPHILHFSGHGSESGELQFSDVLGKPEWVRPEKIAGVIRILRDNLSVIVLNACDSHALAERLHAHIPHVIGMTDRIDDRSAIQFSRVFYEALAFGRTVREAFELACNELDDVVPRMFPY